ncbi:MAG: nuclear transport factor 2 family protein [Spirochaetales bacterium]|nr:nuclear transport factor 2 family protein [Spirochaetales bacterium]
MAKNDSTHPLTKADLSEAKDLDRRFTEALRRKDLDAAMACFWNDPDLVVVLNGKVHRGPDAVRASIKEMFDQNESIRVEVDEVTHLPSGDGVIGVGTATFDLKPSGSSSQLMVERWSDLRRKIDGRWVYVHDHTTVLPK